MVLPAIFELLFAWMTAPEKKSIAQSVNQNISKIPPFRHALCPWRLAAINADLKQTNWENRWVKY